MKRRAFTVMELLLVMVVSGMLLAIALPAFSRIAKGNQLSQGAVAIASKLSLARSYAAGNRCYVAVIFPINKEGKLEGTTVTTQPESLFNAGLRAAIVYKSGNDYIFAKWLPDDSWETLPNGVIIPADAKNFGVEKDSSEEADTDMTPITNVIYDKELFGTQATNITAASTTRAVIFKPSGQIVMPAGKENKSVILRVAEGVLDPLEKKTFISKAAEDGTVNYSVLRINPLTGRSKISYISE